MLDESTDSSEAGGVPAQHTRPKGRPKMQAWQRRRQRAIVPAPPAAEEAEDPDDATWLQHFRPVGSHLQQAIVQRLRGPPYPVPHMLATVSNHVFGPAPRPMMPLAAEARFLQVSRQSLKDYTVLLASSSFHCARMQLASICSFVATCLSSGTMEAGALITYVVYDETPMKSGMRRTRESRFGSKRLKTSSVDQQLLKIENTELIMGFLLKKPNSDEHIFFYTELVCPLQIADRSTGEVVLQQLIDQERLPFLDGLRGAFAIKLHLSTRDRAAGNLRGERGYQIKMPDSIFLGQWCSVHCVHSVVGKALQSVTPMVSGAISVALTMKSSGVGMFQECIAAVLLKSADVHIGGMPPAVDSDCFQFRRSVLDSWVGELPSAPVQKRRVILELKLRGNWQSDKVDVFLPPGVTDEDLQGVLQEWAEDVAEALCPNPWKVFAKSRWCTSSVVADEAFLLDSAHNLMTRAIPEWLERLSKADPAYSKKSSWQVDPAVQLAHQDGPKADGNLFAEFNFKQRVDAKSFARNPLTSTGIILWHSCIKPCVHLTGKLIAFSGDAWDQQQHASAPQGVARKLRLVEAWRGRLTDAFYNEVYNLVFDARKWGHIKFARQTDMAQTLSWAMLARVTGGVHMMVTTPFSQNPYKMIGLLLDPTLPIDEAVRTLEKEPPCMQGDFMQDLFRHFPTTEMKQSSSCRAVVSAIAAILRTDTTRAECRHAWLRRCLAYKGQTWDHEIAVASADWVLTRLRILEREVILLTSRTVHSGFAIFPPLPSTAHM